MNRRVLYVALFLHDIGKGRPEDHSILGAQIARRVAPRLGLDAEECETVEWLVRYHLLMSDIAQKRDLERSAHGARLRQGGEDAQAAGPADRADGLRHPRRGAGHLEQLEGHAAAPALRRHAERAGRRA